jgi:hypothetical protein
LKRPQRHWDLSKQEPNVIPQLPSGPDEALLHSDEFHSLARLLYRLSGYLNRSFDIPTVYYSRGLLGAFMRQVCEPPTVVATQSSSSGELQRVSLPPRIALRPLARHQFFIYCALFFFLCWLVGKATILKFIAVCFILWSVRLMSSAYLAEPGQDKAIVKPL